ncbi:protein SCAI-like isoform X2 [Gossypium australe]|uniref:Protein SCAI-like isoform X2 n=1 Tax=Gossypium australe TaxID=47621 RepID=A0A5B6VY11_9ROSI|nr:protein SCAI-like isoform X2 [Gossypium australe]
MAEEDVVPKTFRALVESADRKFARVRDLPSCGRAQGQHYFQKVFKAYMRLWKYQQEHRAELVKAGLNRWEIGEIAGRIGQLYFGQYMRTSEARFLVEAYIFYEAILKRRYFEGCGVKDLRVRFKELRFYARFLLVSLILNRTEMVKVVVEKLRALIDDCKANFRETNFKEWKLVEQEILRFINIDTTFTIPSSRPFRYCAMLNCHPNSVPYVARFHAKKVLKFRDAILMSYHRNEVKFAELTLDVYRMLQCLEWEPSGSFYQKHPAEPKENGVAVDSSGASGLIDMNLAADMTDTALPPNPRKAILYRPSLTHLIAVMATICEELPPESIMLVYLSASGKPGQINTSHVETSGGSRRTRKSMLTSHSSLEQNCSSTESHINGVKGPSDYYNDYLWLGPKGNGGSSNLYPGDIIPFTRRPLFLIIDKRGEKAALLLSPLRPTFKGPSSADITQNGSQFTLFLTAPLLAFCQMVGFSLSDSDMEVLNSAESILSTAFSKWEVILCKSPSLDLVWAQVLSDPFLRRLIVRFIFCRAVLSAIWPLEGSDQYLPLCLPQLPNSLSPKSDVVQSCVSQLADHLKVSNYFHFEDS